MSDQVFPEVTSESDNPDNNNVTAIWSKGGLTKRELFAAMATQALITGWYSGNNVGFTVEGNCVAAIEYADKLIELLNEER